MADVALFCTWANTQYGKNKAHSRNLNAIREKQNMTLFFGEVGKTRWALYLRKQFPDLSLLSFLAGVVFQQSPARYSHVIFFVLLPFLVYKCGNLAVSHIASDDILPAATDGGYLRSGESLIATDENSFLKKEFEERTHVMKKPKFGTFIVRLLWFFPLLGHLWRKRRPTQLLFIPQVSPKKYEKEMKISFPQKIKESSPLQKERLWRRISLANFIQLIKRKEVPSFPFYFLEKPRK